MTKILRSLAFVLAVSIAPMKAEATAQTCTVQQDNLASKKLANSTSLIEIYRISKLFPACLEGGGISEEISDDVVNRLSRDWTGSLRELQKHAANGAFVSFVLRYIDATTGSDELPKIMDNSKFNCPKSGRIICRKIAVAVAAALRG